MVVLRFTNAPIMFSSRTLRTPSSDKMIQPVFLEPLTTPRETSWTIHDPVVTWKGLSQIKIVEHPDLSSPPRPIKTISLPNISSLILPIPEEEKPITTSQVQKQELALETLEKIDISKLNQSIIQKKGGYSLKTLKIFAKQLGIKANQPKPMLARQILDRIKLKEK